MKETIYSILFIILIIGFFALIALTPLWLRDYFKKKRTLHRAHNFQQHELPSLDLPIIVTPVTTRESLTISYKAYLKRRNGPIIRTLFALYLLLVTGAVGHKLYQRIVLHDSDASFSFIYCLQIMILIYWIYSYYIRPRIYLNQLKHADEALLKEAPFSPHFTFEKEHISISHNDEVVDTLPWEFINYVELIKDDYLILVMQNNDSILISRHDDFQRGSFEELRQLVSPLMK